MDDILKRSDADPQGGIAGGAPSSLCWLTGRRSVRRYRPEPIDPILLDRLVGAACWAPSAHNRQPWRFAVVEGADTKDRLACAMGERLRQDRLRDGDDPASVAADIARSHARLVEAPALVVISLSMADMDIYPDIRRGQAEYLMAVQSTAMAAQNLLLAAHGAGLGTCVLCAPLFCPEEVRAALDLPMDWQPQCLVTLGRPAGVLRERKRRAARELMLRR